MTRLGPPQQQTKLLTRRRIDDILASALDYPLTIMVAPAGSGKTTALASFVARGGWPSGWCRATPDDDAASLLRHLSACWRPVVTIDEERINKEIDRGGAAQAVLELLVNELAAHLADETLLVIEDYHHIDGNPELHALIARLIDVLPLRLHLLLSTRYEPELAALSTADARGEVCRLVQSDLAFNEAEARALFTLYERPVPEQIMLLNTRCRGWPLALQALASGSGTPALDNQAFVRLLDAYLQQQVFAEQPSALQQLLLYTAHLRWIDYAVCKSLPLLRPLADQLGELERRCLYLEPLPRSEQPIGPGTNDEALRRLAYQPLFNSFLARKMAQHPDERKLLHLQAADYFYATKTDQESEVHHLLAAGEEQRAAQRIAQASADWLQQGRAEALLRFLDRLTDQSLRQPVLLEMRAAANRRLGNYLQAIEAYQHAEQAYQQGGDRDGRVRALRGRAEVYLDTVQPAPAVALLKQALKLLPREAFADRAQILRLQAENWANHGRADVAMILATAADQQEELIAQGQDAVSLSSAPPPSPAAAVAPRLLLRSGRLQEARAQLEAALAAQQLPAADAHFPVHGSVLAHREPPLLLAFVYTLLGNSARALALARRGLIEAQKSGIQVTEAIAHMRVGHAYQVVTPIDAATANRHYLQALALAQDAGVARTRAEAYLGLALLHGHGGDLAAAEAATREGLELAQVAGDNWVAALLWLALGGAGVAAGIDTAPQWLEQARLHFHRGGDQYGQAMVDMWMAIWHVQHAEEPLARERVWALFERARHFGFEGPLIGPSLFGPRDLPMLVPLLLRARATAEHSAYARQLLRQAFPAIASDEAIGEYHPGYTLRIQLLGTFRVWRGMREIQTREWQREKARQLLQLLLTYRGQWLQREQICSWLWPDSDLDAAEKQFKVTLNALNAALEPLRPPRIEPFFIRRQGLAYSFAPSYGCWIDVDEFELRANAIASLQGEDEALLRNLQHAVQLYRGDYLVETLYDAWTIEERERLLARYLAITTELASHLLRTDALQQAIQLCELVIQRDHCYEEAYQLLMRAHAQSGSRSQALRSYARCVRALQEELDIEPLPETTRLYEQIKRNQYKA